MTGIQWTDETWNPVIGCRRVSEGCRNCYAEKMAARIVAMAQAQGRVSPYEDVVQLDASLEAKPRWNGTAKLLPHKLDEPLRWRKPRRAFVNSMSYLFHKDITFEQIAAVFGVMAAAPRHTFQVLTKRPGRALEFFGWVAEQESYINGAGGSVRLETPSERAMRYAFYDGYGHLHRKLEKARKDAPPWPLPNVWLGTSCENQEAADERSPLLLECPAAVRFVSAEPLLGPIDFNAVPVQAKLKLSNVATMHAPKFDWVIVGGESGPNARRCAVEWVRDIVEQCGEAGVPVFVMQLGALATEDAEGMSNITINGRKSFWRHDVKLSHPKGGDPDEWPEDLRVRQFPGVPE
jgi:protein gp37